MGQGRETKSASGGWDRGQLSWDLQRSSDYNANMKRIVKEMRSNCVQGIQGACRVSACMNAGVRGIRIKCGECNSRKICLALLSIWGKPVSTFRKRVKYEERLQII